MTVSKRIKISATKRVTVYTRDNWTCQYCGLRFDARNTWSPREGAAPFMEGTTVLDYVFLEVDHVHPLRHGGSNSIDNLRAACTPCNKRKGAKLGGVF